MQQDMDFIFFGNCNDCIAWCWTMEMNVLFHSICKGFLTMQAMFFFSFQKGCKWLASRFWPQQDSFSTNICEMFKSAAPVSIRAFYSVWLIIWYHFLWNTLYINVAVVAPLHWYLWVTNETKSGDLSRVCPTSRPMTLWISGIL